ncbi:hypothetical protein EUA06_16610 [Nocardioides glacieisoli]|uniref:Uncharacterized protein n=1 Tax=Nocardioides glacieisoli TaxID=1168730 RepID=A0A4Q2RK70_9ACTN|nr:hypothetical protein [Nocardioides glacieisoli]RYB89111.1 hypothetical protein EUA06_16610 [Nocardioides glacieisoli]
MTIPIMPFSQALKPLTGAREIGRLLLIAESMATNHFEAGRIAEGEALALEMEEFHTSMQDLSEAEVRSALEGAVAWARFKVDLARGAALEAAQA